MKNTTLKNFIEENFDFEELVKVGIFKKEMKGNYKIQANKICRYFGYKTIYEYGSKNISCHISYAKDERPLVVDKNGRLRETPFVTEIKSIYES